MFGCCTKAKSKKLVAAKIAPATSSLDPTTQTNPAAQTAAQKRVGRDLPQTAGAESNSKQLQPDAGRLDKNREVTTPRQERDEEAKSERFDSDNEENNGPPLVY